MLPAALGFTQNKPCSSSEALQFLQVCFYGGTVLVVQELLKNCMLLAINISTAVDAARVLPVSSGF